MAKSVVKSKVKKGKSKVVDPIVTTASPISTATKAYIYDKMDKLPLAQIAEDTQLTVAQVEKLVNSRELDKRPDDGNKPASSIRRYDVQGDTVSLTPAQARLNDIASKEHAANQMENLKKVMGPDLEIIVLNPK